MTKVDSLLDKMVGVIPAGRLEEIRRLLKSRLVVGTRGVRKGAATCVVCGNDALGLDYACASCSETKAGSERLFWQRATDGYKHPSNASKKQVLPPQTRKGVIEMFAPIEDELPTPPRVKQLKTFAVKTGLVTRILVAEFGFEAVREAHRLNKDGDTASHSVMEIDLPAVGSFPGWSAKEEDQDE